MVDTLIVGAGPSGLSSAITLASEGKSVLVLEKSSKAGGQAGTSSLIENFPPFSAGFSGTHFTEEACEQCRKFGVGILCNTEVVDVACGKKGFYLKTNRGYYKGRSVLLALGLQNRTLDVPGEDLPHVHYGMNTDAFDCTKTQTYAAHVVLVGGGNSVGQAAMHYLEKGVRVTVAAKKPLIQTMSAYLLDRLLAHPRNLSVVYGEVQSIRKAAPRPAPEVDGLQLRVVGDFPTRVMGVDCVHIFVGQQPGTEWLRGMVDLDAEGYVITNEQHETTLPGIFAVGDAVSGSVKRLACAVGSGNEAVHFIHQYLEGKKEAA